jgi:catechol 2,3-dioxygenase-like lactoylglutathione lyase family enzyme
LRRVVNRAADAVGFDLAWNHVALSVPNIAESIAWYEKRLGFKGTARNGQPGARQQIADLRRDDITIELFQVPDAAPLPESRKNPSEDFRTHGVKHFGFEVKNLPAALAECERQDSIKVASQGTCQRAGITGLTFHDLRREYGSRLVEGRMNLLTVSRPLGHARVSTTDTHLRASELLAEKNCGITRRPAGITLRKKSTPPVEGNARKRHTKNASGSRRVS